MLEIIAVPLAAEAFHDVDPIARIVLLVLVQLVKASLSLAEQMRADEGKVFVIDMDLPSRDLVFHSAVRILPRHGIPAGLIHYIWGSMKLIRRKAIRRGFINRRQHGP